MKLNPFRRKTSGYFDKIKADYAECTRDLEALRREVDEAKTSFEDAQRTLFDVEQKSNSTVWTRREQELLRQKNAAEHHYDELRTRLGHLELKHRSLRWKAEAPDALAKRVAELKALATRRRQIEAERDKQRSAIAKLEARIATLRGEIDQETESATQAGFSLPSTSTVKRVTTWNQPPPTSSTSMTSAVPRILEPAGTGAGNRTLFQP